MSHLQKHVDYLGFKAKDKVTGYKGIISSVSFDLYGCIQVVITPEKLKENGELSSGVWLDISRIDILSKKRIIENPYTIDDNQTKQSIIKGQKGPAEKPNKY